MVNVSLLAKWRWRLLTCENAFRKEVLIAKYSNIIRGVVDLGGEIWPRVGDGGFTKFWKDCWVGKCLFVINFHGFSCCQTKKKPR
jgi:hypothetical protein